MNVIQVQPQPFQRKYKSSPFHHCLQTLVKKWCNYSEFFLSHFSIDSQSKIERGKLTESTPLCIFAHDSFIYMFVCVKC